MTKIESHHPGPLVLEARAAGHDIIFDARDDSNKPLIGFTKNLPGGPAGYGGNALQGRGDAWEIDQPDLGDTYKLEWRW